jgi:hypothetical protein
VSVSLPPAGEVFPCDIEQLGTGAQPFRHLAGKQKADFVNPGVIHGGSIAGRPTNFERGFASLRNAPLRGAKNPQSSCRPKVRVQPWARRDWISL